MQEEQKPEEDVDPVWQEAKEQLYEPQRANRYSRSRSEQKPEYTAEKVEDLKRNLIKTLKHAANIRALKPDDWLIFTVTGGNGRRCSEISAQTVYYSAVIKKDGKVITSQAPSPTLPEINLASPTVLTIRVKKTQVDAFSKGELDFDEFQQKVQILTY